MCPARRRKPFTGPPAELESDMATILNFEPRESGDKSSSRVLFKEPAEVVIFPGVRIEREEFRLSDRLTEPEPDKPGARGRMRRTSRK